MKNIWVLNVFSPGTKIQVDLEKHFAFEKELGTEILRPDVNFGLIQEYYEAIGLEINPDELESKWRNLILGLNQTQLEQIVPSSRNLRIKAKPMDSISVLAQRKGILTDSSYMAAAAVVILYDKNREGFVLIKHPHLGFPGGFCGLDIPDKIPGIAQFDDPITRTAAINLYTKLGLVASNFREGISQTRLDNTNNPLYNNLSLLGCYSSFGLNTSCATVFVYEATLMDDFETGLRRYYKAFEAYEKMVRSENPRFAQTQLLKLQDSEGLPSLAWRVSGLEFVKAEYQNDLKEILGDEDLISADACGTLNVYLAKYFRKKMHKIRGEYPCLGEVNIASIE
jgi:hypothetical protein